LLERKKIKRFTFKIEYLPTVETVVVVVVVVVADVDAINKYYGLVFG